MCSWMVPECRWLRRDARLVRNGEGYRRADRDETDIRSGIEGDPDEIIAAIVGLDVDQGAGSSGGAGNGSKGVQAIRRRQPGVGRDGFFGGGVYLRVENDLV